MFNIKEPVNALTHLAGAVLSSVALVWMIIKGVSNGSTLQIVSALVFGLSLIALYTASTVYHWVPSSEKSGCYTTQSRPLYDIHTYCRHIHTGLPDCLKRNFRLDPVWYCMGTCCTWYCYEVGLV